MEPRLWDYTRGPELDKCLNISYQSWSWPGAVFLVSEMAVFSSSIEKKALIRGSRGPVARVAVQRSPCKVGRFLVKAWDSLMRSSQPGIGCPERLLCVGCCLPLFRSVQAVEYE